MTLDKLARLTGLTKGYLSKIERSRKAPPFSTLETIAVALNRNITYFLEKPQQENNKSKNEEGYYKNNVLVYTLCG
ncbi:MAG: helix-turn-helix transcriptional regulator [Candidatus Omnitrophica bacterium]|nr:helix-turn-helix transcriptional regulator [Candidatus Omnitrophota bacterium]